MFSVVVWLTLGSKTTRLGLREDHGSGSANKTTSFGFTQDTNCDDYTRIKKSSLFEVIPRDIPSFPGDSAVNDYR